MKKFLIFALLLLPVASFGASSVRVLGSGSVTPGAGSKTTTTTSTTKVTPAKATPSVKANAVNSGTGSASRIGTIRAKTKTGTGTASTVSNSAGSRFPVITPAHTYNTVSTPKASGTSTSTGNVEPASTVDDPRFDMIRISSGSPESNWDGNPLLKTRKDQGYVFMWIEE